MPPKEKYTDPKLREEVKEEVKKGDKGGASGQWSARKAQMMASEYKKRGGDYNDGKKDESQKNLSKWGEEDWQTKDGSGDAKQADGTQKRYLPKKAWEKMTDEEKKATDEQKLEGSKKGKQHVSNTDTAKEAREEANEEEDKEHEKKEETKTNAKAKKAEPKKKEQPKKEEQQTGEKRKTRSQTANESEGAPNKAQKTEEKAEPKSKTPQKGKKDDSKKDEGKKDEGKNDEGKSNGKARGKHTDEDNTFGSKRDSADAPGKQGSNDRLPKKGQKVHWKSMPGWVEGEVVKISEKDEEVDGKRTNGKKGEPRIVLKSSSSGKIAVHKPDAVYFD